MGSTSNAAALAHQSRSRAGSGASAVSSAGSLSPSSGIPVGGQDPMAIPAAYRDPEARGLASSLPTTGPHTHALILPLLLSLLCRMWRDWQLMWSACCGLPSTACLGLRPHAPVRHWHGSGGAPPVDAAGAVGGGSCGAQVRGRGVAAGPLHCSHRLVYHRPALP